MTLKGVDVLRRRNLAHFDGHNSIDSLVRDIDRHGRRRRDAIRLRIGTLLAALEVDAPELSNSGPNTPGPNTPGPSTPGLGGHGRRRTRAGVVALCAALQPLDHRRAWLMLAVLSGRLPQSEHVVTAVRRAAADGMVSALRLAIWSGPLPRVLDAGPFPEVRVISNTTLVDVDHTAQVNFATGIQRVTRESVRRWAPDRAVTLIGWHQGEAALRSLTPLEVRRACWGGPPVGEAEPGPVLVPVDCVYLLPELATETVRTDALRALAEHSSNSLRVIGYDMVPITVPETCGPAMPAAFARNLAAVRYSATVATISEAAAVEYRGWTDMLPQIGLRGPRIVPCLLPNQPVPSSEKSLVAAAERLLIGGMPMVLVVGSHEPRKNHLAVLHAAELCWREGLRFSMTFIGGNSWSGERFAAALSRLQQHGRPVETISAADDDLLWAGYRLARFTVFPSLNEGFGLPVVESLSCGTPVITSDFGSMREIAAQGGARLVDPRDDHALAGAMRELLTDDDELARLSQQAWRRPARTWDTYASEVWDVLTA